tara:strand:+ start:5048 stop:5389 length:342 start_codon:yes stop_codon:yes gene_type:complete
MIDIRLTDQGVVVVIDDITIVKSYVATGFFRYVVTLPPDNDSYDDVIGIRDDFTNISRFIYNCGSGDIERNYDLNRKLVKQIIAIVKMSKLIYIKPEELEDFECQIKKALNTL